MNMPLAGCRIGYTRALPHWLAARQTLGALGATAEHYPLMDSRAVPFVLPSPLDVIVFTSANAVRHFFAQSPLPCPAVAIGEKTAQALEEYGHPPASVAPPPYDSEALLSVWQPVGRDIAIAAAPGGRRYLFNRLQASNRVSFLYVYERFCPLARFHPHPLPHALLIGSGRTLDHLLKIAEPNTLKLLQCCTCIVALSPRIAHYATDLGFHRVISAPCADEAAQFGALCQWWERQQGALK